VKYKPITNPEFAGCLNCSSTPHTTLDKTKTILVYGWIVLKIQGKRDKVFYDYIESPNKLFKKYKGLILRSECTLLEVSGMLHGEVYEFNKEDSQWYLVEQNQGLA